MSDEDRTHSMSVPAFRNSTPIPNDLINKLSMRAKNFLIRENILTCEHLLNLQGEKLFQFAGVGRNTAIDIKRLQREVIQRHPDCYQVIMTTAQDIKPIFKKKAEKKPIVDNKRAILVNATGELRNSEYGVSTPAEWSLLSCTLPDVFSISTPYSDPSTEDSPVTIGSLGFSVEDIAQLRRVVLFPEEPADYLLSCTLGYLIQVNLSEDALSILLDRLLNISGFSGRILKSDITETISDRAIYSDMQISQIEEFQVHPFLYTEIIDTNDNAAAVVTWGKIATITERSIIERIGFTIRGLKIIQSLWQLKDRAIELVGDLSKGLPAVVYADFDRLVDALLQPIAKKKHDLNVLKGRLGLLEGRKWTLEELGQRANMTREAVRQIEKRVMQTLQKRHAAASLIRFWLALDEMLITCGGVCFIAEIAKSFAIRWKWNTLPSDDALAALISLSENYKVIWEQPLRVIMPHHKCVNCSHVRSFLADAVKSQHHGVLSFNDANIALQTFCRSRCIEVPEVNQFTKGYFVFLNDSIEEISADDANFYTEYAWAQKYGKQRMILVETILRNAGRPMHFTEVHAEVNKDRPTDKQLSERNIYGCVERSTDLLLWDRGTYIHRDHVSIPHDLICNIEEDIISRLQEDIPYLSVSGIYDLFKKKLQAKNVPSESALYSCLRESNNTLLRYPDYPYVVKKDHAGQRLPVQLVLEAYVLGQEGIVTFDQIKTYAIEKLCVNESVFMASHFQNIPNLLRINRGEYLHIQQLGIERDTLEPILDHLRTLLRSSNHVSTIKLFNEKKITCRLLGISTPMLLFSIIQFYYSDQFGLSRYPSIRLSGLTTEADRTTGVATEVISYIRSKGAPCSFLELYQHFVDELGYGHMSVYNVVYSRNKIIRYSEGVVVHVESLELAESQQAALELLAAEHLASRESTGNFYGLISYLYDYMYDQLPKLPCNIAWTPTLIGELLSYEKKYRILGTQRNAFVAVNNSYGIATLDDLLFHILDSEYDGAANIERFISDMREGGILMKSLTPLMLGPDSRVVLKGTVVQLARL